VHGGFGAGASKKDWRQYLVGVLCYETYGEENGRYCWIDYPNKGTGKPLNTESMFRKGLPLPMPNASLPKKSNLLRLV
jgi:hypothetical protein